MSNKVGVDMGAHGVKRHRGRVGHVPGKNQRDRRDVARQSAQRAYGGRQVPGDWLRAEREATAAAE